MELTRAEQMLLQAVSASIHGKAVEWTAVSGEEWSELMRLATQHKVLPLVFSAVCDCPAAKQWEQKQEFRRLTKQQTAIQIRKTADFLMLYRRMLEADTKPLVVKGILCRALYPNGDLRQSSDEDLYVSAEDFSKCSEILKECGMHTVSDESAEEIGWKSPDSLLYLELHRGFFAKNRNALSGMQTLFENAFSSSAPYSAEGVQTVFSLSEHDHLLYLLCHSYKHFIRSGFGIRQVCDIGLWAKKYSDKIDWERLYRQCKSVHALDLSAALFQIAESDLSVGLKLPELWQSVRTDRMPLLKDILSAGVYGSAEQSRVHSASVTQNAVSAGRANRGSGVLRSVFPTAAALQKDYPILQKNRLLLPVIWCKRLMRYRKETKNRSGATVTEPIKIAKERKKLLKYYRIL